MSKPPIPANEAERLAALAQYRVLDTPPEATFDELTQLAAHICGTQMSALSLIDVDRQWFKSRVGIADPQTSRDVAFCAHAILDRGVMVVPDATADPRFSQNPLVTGDPNIRFYAGAPLITPGGHSIGTLCVIDRQTRKLTSEQQEMLQMLSRQVVLQLELRRYASALADSELRSRQILNALPLGVFVVDKAGRPTFANDAATGILGRGVLSDSADRLAETYQVFEAGSDRVYAEDRLPVVRAVRGEPSHVADIEIRRPDGRILLDVTGTPVTGEDGSVIAGAAVFRDITGQYRERRRRRVQHVTSSVLAAAARIRDAVPALLRGVCDALECGVGMAWIVEAGQRRLISFGSCTDGSGGLDAFARRREAMSWRKGEGQPGVVWMTGQPIWADYLSVAPDLAEARAAGLLTAYAVPVSRGGQVAAVLEFFSTQIQEPDQELMDVLTRAGSQVADFIERRHAERALRISEARTRSIVDSMHGALVTLHDDGSVESVNPAAVRVFGYAAEEIEGQSLDLLLVARGDAFRDVQAIEPHRTIEREGRRKSGQVFPMDVTVFQFETPDGLRWAVNALDVSERRAVDKLKQEFVSTVSHELRTPLTSIRGSLGLLQAGALGDLPGEAHEVVTLAERNTVRLIALINDILDLERLESGRIDLQLALEAIEPVLRRAVDAVHAFAEQHGITVTVEAEPLRLRMDADRIVQVLVNLISNAVKFSDRGSAVDIAARADGDWAEVRVIDYGRGIPASHREAVFERFKQVESSDARREGGTGLGLAICRSIVERHDGTIGVDSIEGQGSTFWFRLPLTGATGA